MARAAGCSPAARRPARTTERDGKWLQDRIVRRLLLPGRRAVRRVRSTRRAGWNGMRCGCVCSAAGRREVSLALAGGSRELLAPARVAPFCHVRARRPTASRHLHTHKPIRGIRARMRSEARAAFLHRFEKASAKETTSPALVFPFRRHTVVLQVTRRALRKSYPDLLTPIRE